MGDEETNTPAVSLFKLQRSGQTDPTTSWKMSVKLAEAVGPMGAHDVCVCVDICACLFIAQWWP